MDCSPQDSSVHEIYQTRTLEWVAVSFSKGSSQPRIEPVSPELADKFLTLSHEGSPRILEWELIPSPVDLPNPGIEAGSPALQVDSLPTELPGKPKLISHPTNPPYIPGPCQHLQSTAPHLPHPLPNIHTPIVKTHTVSPALTGKFFTTEPPGKTP